MSHSNERGIALITTLLVMMLISALLVAFTTVVMTDQRYRFIDKDRGQAFYGAAAGVEKLTADLGTLFLQNVAPTQAQIAALTTTPPVITGVTYNATVQPDPLPASEMTPVHCYSTAAQAGPPPIPAISRGRKVVGGNGYAISYCANTGTNNPTTLADAKTITQGPYAGLYALKTPYQIDVTAQTSTGGEAHLVRTLETVSIPVFQFGIFSDVDLAFNAADTFSFGGRVHTNGNLFLSQGNGSTLTMSDRVTAYGEVVRAVISNGNTIANAGKTGTVSIAKGGGAFRTLASTEGSVVAGPGSAFTASWPTTISPAYFGYLKNGSNGNPANGTGAKKLTLPIVAPGVNGQNIDLLRRPLVGEPTTSILYQERMFSKASIRVLLSDTAADITNIPGIDNTVAPVSLEAGSFPAAANVFAASVPIAQSPGPVSAALTAAVAAGAGKTLTFAATPAGWKAPAALTACAGGAPLCPVGTWNITNCTTKTTSTFTGCTVQELTPILNGALSIPIGATVSGNNTSAALTVAVATGAGKTLTFAANSTLGFSQDVFWWNDQQFSCTGYTANTLTGCTVPAMSNGDLIQNYVYTPANTSVIGGFIKVERQNANDSTWHDITNEMLNYGIAAPQQTGSCAAAADPTPNAIIRLQRLADDAGNLVNAGRCIASTSTVAVKERTATSYDYWPNVLFDTREAWQREAAPAGANLKVAGVIYYVTIDAGNLAKWFAGAAPYTVANGSTGTQSKPDNGGFSVYFSDRRNNRNALNQETGELGFEDNVNPLNASDVPNGVLDAGEDLNANTTLETYGNVPSCNGLANYAPGAAVGVGPITCSVNTAWANPWPPTLKSDMALAAEPAAVIGMGRAQSNRPLFFRRALKLVNGSNLVANVIGFTVVSENPVYVQGDWNANGGWVNPDAATAILADAVTILSNNWKDINSFPNAYNAGAGSRNRSANSWYRFAILAGKNAIFPLPANQAACCATFGTDGGAHAFLRYLEGSPGNDTINYQGSMATMFYSRQAVGIFKGNDGFVYGIPANRNYVFDTNFLAPQLLPPLTPMFRDNNAVGFSQQLQPNK